MPRRKIAANENTDLNLHVELCSERYTRLEEKFTVVENSLEHLHKDFDSFKQQSETSFREIKNLINESKEKRFNTLVATTGTIIVGLLGMLGYIITSGSP